MRLRKIAMALFACMALGALAANAAQAASEWTLGTSENQTTAGTRIAKEGITCKKHGTTELILHSTVLGAALTLKATGIECESATIDTIVGPPTVAHSAGFLNFTGVTVEPSTCAVSGGHLTTKELTDEVITDPTTGSAVIFDKFFTHKNAKEELEPFVEVTLEGEKCPFAGVTAPVSGTACGESVHTTGIEKEPWAPNKSGTLTKDQTLLFGSSQQTTGGCALKLGKAEAQLTGAVDNTLSGSVTPANKEKPFGADA